MRKAICFAEWVTLGVSTLVVLALVAYLAYGVSREHDRYVAIRTEVEVGRVAKEGGRLIVPVSVANLSRKPIQHLKVRSSGTQKEIDFELDYLGAQASEDVFIFVENEADLKALKFEPVSYMSE